ncbi:MAG: hypothetical protein JNL11_15795 [Bdellovibrionaceae bacterium]|nr:hypothetical protein [Pseudobdellovibrionaceae bacterium]
MEGDSSHSFIGTLIKNLSSALSEHKDSPENIIEDLDWMEDSALRVDDQDMVNSINIHKRILDCEIDVIDKELDSIIRDKETVDYLINLLKKREKLENQVHQLDDELHGFQKGG